MSLKCTGMLRLENIILTMFCHSVSPWPASEIFTIDFCWINEGPRNHVLNDFAMFAYSFSFPSTLEEI